MQEVKKNNSCKISILALQTSVIVSVYELTTRKRLGKKQTNPG